MRHPLRWAVLAAVLSLGCGTARSATLFGDVNGDGKINVQDATLELRIAVGLVTPTPDQIIAGDVAPFKTDTGIFGDGKINVSDAGRILRRAVGLDGGATWPGSISFNQPSQPQPTQAVALPTHFNISVQGDTTRDFSLPGGFKLQGKLTGTLDSSVSNESLLFVDETTKVVAYAQVKDGGFLVGVPAGNYKVYYSASVTTNGGIVIPTTSDTSGSTTGGTTGSTTGDIPCIPNIPGVPDIPGVPKCTDSGGTTGDTTGGTTGGTTGSTTGDTTGGITCIPNIPGIPDIPGVPKCDDSGNGLAQGESRPLQIPGLALPTQVEVALNTSIQVSADTTQDIARPVLPHLFNVKGKIVGPGLQTPITLSIRQVKDENGADLSLFRSGASTTATSLDGTYSVYLPTGTYEARIISSTDFANPLVGIPQIKVTSDTTQDLTVNPKAKVTLSGSVTGADGAPLPNNVGTVSAFQNSVFDASGSFFGHASVSGGQYNMKLIPGDYLVSMILSQGSSTDGLFGGWSLQVGQVSVSADTQKNIAVPALPSQKFTVKGRVLGPDGGVVLKGNITFSATKLSNADANLSFSSTGELKDGQYSVSLPPGDYQVLITPDLGFDLASVVNTNVGVNPASP